MQTIEQLSVGESFEPEIDPSVSVDAGTLHDTIESMADGMDVSAFKCVKCGMVHDHDTTKHKLADSFDIDESDAASIEYNSNCHCGLQEAARRGSDFGIDRASAASAADNAPIPDPATRAMNDEFGTI